MENSIWKYWISGCGIVALNHIAIGLFAFVNWTNFGKWISCVHFKIWGMLCNFSFIILFWINQLKSWFVLRSPNKGRMGIIFNKTYIYMRIIHGICLHGNRNFQHSPKKYRIDLKVKLKIIYIQVQYIH